MQEMTTNIEWHVAKNLWKFQVLRPGMIICVIIYPILLSLNCYGYVVVESVCEHPTVDRNREVMLICTVIICINCYWVVNLLCTQVDLLWMCTVLMLYVWLFISLCSENLFLLISRTFCCIFSYRMLLVVYMNVIQCKTLCSWL